MTLKAGDLPADGSSKLALVDGTLFEVQRLRLAADARRSIYKARMLPTSAGVVAVKDEVGWWYRFTWKLMLADLKLMAKTENEE